MNNQCLALKPHQHVSIGKIKRQRCYPDKYQHGQGSRSFAQALTSSFLIINLHQQGSLGCQPQLRQGLGQRGPTKDLARK